MILAHGSSTRSSFARDSLRVSRAALLCPLALILGCSNQTIQAAADAYGQEELAAIAAGIAAASASAAASNQAPEGEGQGAEQEEPPPPPPPEQVLAPEPKEVESDTLEEKDVCAGVTLESEEVVTEVPKEIVTTIETEKEEQVVMYIVLDNSKSMAEGGDGTFTKWEQAENALTEFVLDPSSTGLEVGIQYFHPLPPSDFLGDKFRPDKCDGTGHSASAIPVAALPMAADSVIQSLDETGPNSSTPTVGALTGGVQFCMDHQAANPEEQCVVVFITDGQPNSCGLSLGCHEGYEPDSKGHCVDPTAEAVLTPIASNGLDNDVITYTVGMEGVTGDGFELLDALAVAGGTDCTPGIPGKESCNVSETGAAGLVETLNKIRDTIVIVETVTETVIETVIETVKVPCTWKMPKPDEGEFLDPDLVNVTLDVNGEIKQLGRVDAEADCAAAGGGWYYDVPDAPEFIHACPSTCELVESDGKIGVNVVFGCETVLGVPM